MDSLAMRFLAEEIYSNQDDADLFNSKEEVEEFLGANLRRINLKEKYVAIFKNDQDVLQVETFDELRTTSSKIGSDALILRTNLLERKLYDQTEPGLFQYSQ